jgi:uroporphyrinogen decarboxylase
MDGADGQPDGFLAACQGKQGSRTPVWFMRQAGRSLPEYRAARGDGSMLEAVRHPELAAELTLQPVRRYHVDAAILYSDIVVPLAATGFGVELRPGTGPVVAHPFRSKADLHRLRPFEPAEDAPWVADTVRILVAESPVPVIGFAGGPFTLASYLVEGGPSRDHLRTKGLMYTEPRLWASLMEHLAGMTVTSLRDQVAAGVAAVQVFDSWIGTLSPSDYRAHVLPASRQIFAGLEDTGVARIHFGVGTGELLGLMVEAGADVIGVDWRVPLSEAARRAPGALAFQGNLDPAVCLAPWEVVATEARRILRERPAGYGHIFNLGHGVLPETDPDILARLVELVHDATPVRSDP